ncbi:vitamin K epoxide reductase family protein [Nocardia sp. NEAU-G5]|uniref:Vitamin K epoxide reductase family protein n=1 Tax=Nocardia albiluteola TaxID=2842303 RepID=A0ABS6AUN1_9NOCA|nr:vitamin K epoxide reductase family protein [Nocardia albiluteola]MBU3060749.1 vitamin K epoxide reductase family protein [Nocardia albiluteola]
MIAAPARSAWTLLVGSLAGWISAVILTVEDFKLLMNPAYKPSCNLNPIIACGSVMATHQARIFGFPNPIMGVVGFSVAVTIAVLAVAGIALPKWFWGGLWLGLVLGIVFICWLIFQTLYRIGALCPYCMVVWVFTPILLAVVTDQIWGNARGFVRILVEWRWTLVVVFYAIVLVMVFLRFQTYWMSLV